MSLDLANTVINILKTTNEKMTAEAIAHKIIELKPEECAKKKDRNGYESDKQLLNQIIAEIASQKNRIQTKEPKIKTVDVETPRKFYFDNENPIIENVVSITPNSSNLNIEAEAEKDLYPKLCSYLHSRRSVYPKRIDEKKSKNNQGTRGNIYLFPDIVGLEYCTKSYEKEILDLMNETEKVDKIKLYSFEVKIRITRTTVRNSYFQTAGNSLWANYRYLVAKEIDEEAMEECKILSSQFGIGLIQIDVENPTENSKIIIDSPFNKINWGLMNRIASQNSDFTDYVNNIVNTLKINKVHEEDWNIPIIADEEEQ
jgi:hypothetical protein